MEKNMKEFREGFEERMEKTAKYMEEARKEVRNSKDKESEVSNM